MSRTIRNLEETLWLAVETVGTSAMVLVSVATIAWLASLLNGCTLTYEPESKACMLHFSPSGEQIRALGDVCMDALRVVHDEPTKVEIEAEDSGL